MRVGCGCGMYHSGLRVRLFLHAVGCGLGECGEREVRACGAECGFGCREGRRAAFVNPSPAATAVDSGGLGVIVPPLPVSRM